MQRDRFTDLKSLVAHVDDGDMMALAHTLSADFSAASMSATPALIRHGAKRLHLLGVPALSLQADILIGAGCVATVESGSVLLYEYGAANRFVASWSRTADKGDPESGIALEPLQGAPAKQHQAPRKTYKPRPNNTGKRPGRTR